MEGLWILFLIFGLLSRILDKNKKNAKNARTQRGDGTAFVKPEPNPDVKPAKKASDLDVSAKRFFEQMERNFGQPTDAEAPVDTQQPEPATEEEPCATEYEEGACGPEAHLPASQEGIRSDGIRRSNEGRAFGREGFSTEGSFAKGSLKVASIMEGSEHPLGAPVELRPGKKTVPPLRSARSVSAKEWRERMVWKEILSEPRALKRHARRH